jgi:hypothetical protein
MNPIAITVLYSLIGSEAVVSVKATIRKPKLIAERMHKTIKIYNLIWLPFRELNKIENPKPKIENLHVLACHLSRQALLQDFPVCFCFGQKNVT